MLPSPLFAAWTAAVTLSDGNGGTQSSIRPGSGGTMHLVYQTGGYRVCYRKRNADGSWTPIEVLAPFYTARADVCEDSAGRVIVAMIGDEPGIPPDNNGFVREEIYYRYKDATGWHPDLAQYPTRLTFSTYSKTDNPRLQVVNGVAHLVYSEGENAAQILHHIWNGTGWNAATLVDTETSNDNAYYHRPSIFAQGSTLHLCYVKTISGNRHIMYSSWAGGAWSAPVIAADQQSDGFISYPKIAAKGANDVLCFWFEQRDRPKSSRFTKALPAGKGRCLWAKAITRR